MEKTTVKHLEGVMSQLQSGNEVWLPSTEGS